MISVIIPTIWLHPDAVHHIINQLILESSIGEIILINNNRNYENSSIPNHPKLVLVVPEKNIGCNPAWNIGAKMASFDKLFFLSDDFAFDFSICKYIEPHITETRGLILSNTNSSSNDMPIRLVPANWPENRTLGWASGFFVHKKVYNPIPEQLKVYCGDNWLLDTIPYPHYMIHGVSFNKYFSYSVNFVRNLGPHHPLYIDFSGDQIEYENIKKQMIVPDRIKANEVISLI